MRSPRTVRMRRGMRELYCLGASFGALMIGVSLAGQYSRVFDKEPKEVLLILIWATVYI